MDELIKSQKEILGINDFLDEAKIYTKDVIGKVDLDKSLDSILSGDVAWVFESLNIKESIVVEMSSVVKLFVIILEIIIISSILKNILESLNVSSVSKNIYFIQYLVIVILIVNSFVPILNATIDSINRVIGFMNMLIPILITLVLTTGNIVATSMMEPALIMMMNFVAMFVNSFVVPFCLMSFVISILANLLGKIKLEKISNIFKNVTIWTLGIVLTVFTTVLSLESTITSSVDGLAGKATKMAVSGFIPVVGKIMGDSADTVLGSVNVLKNSVGIMGTIIIFVIAVMPSVKVACYWIVFKTLAALSEPCADENVVNLFEVISDNYKVLLGILFSITIMFVIGIAIVLKTTNMSLMYR